MPHRTLQEFVVTAEPFIELARWILERMDDLQRGEKATVEAAKRHVIDMGDASLKSLLSDSTDWIRVADALVAEGVAILEQRKNLTTKVKPIPPPASGPPVKVGARRK